MCSQNYELNSHWTVHANIYPPGITGLIWSWNFIVICLVCEHEHSKSCCMASFIFTDLCSFPSPYENWIVNCSKSCKLQITLSFWELFINPLDLGASQATHSPKSGQWTHLSGHSQWLVAYTQHTHVQCWDSLPPLWNVLSDGNWLFSLHKLHIFSRYSIT